jgi:hypothetical protein
LFSEQSLQQIVSDIGGLLFCFFDGFSLIEGQSLADIFQCTNLPSQNDFKIFETLWFLVGIAPRFHQSLVSVFDGIDIFAEAFLKHFRFTGPDRIAGEAQQNLGYGDVAPGSIDWIGQGLQMRSFPFEALEPFIDLYLKK